MCNHWNGCAPGLCVLLLLRGKWRGERGGFAEMYLYPYSSTLGTEPLIGQYHVNTTRRPGIENSIRLKIEIGISRGPSSVQLRNHHVLCLHNGGEIAGVIGTTCKLKVYTSVAR